MTNAEFEDVVAEFHSLRKGRGVNAGGLDRRIGARLRELITLVGGTAAPRHTIVETLSRLAAGLSDDLRTALLASLGISAETRQLPIFEDRVSWLASQLHCAPRTALRRIATAEQLLAEEVVREIQRLRRRLPAAPNGWYLRELRTVLRLDTPTPESYEQRRIVSTQEGLAEIMAWLNVPGTPEHPRPTITGEVIYGGQLIRRQEPARNRFQFIIRLPQPMRIGEEHEYGLLLRVGDGQSMRTHYIFTPEYECQLFDLRVRFGSTHPPRWVRRVDGEPVRVFDGAQPYDDLIFPDKTGEIHLRFPNPTLYLGYGVQWQM
jgi:hypothetical protein